MLNPITTLTTTIASTMTGRIEPSRSYQSDGQEPLQPPGANGSQLALLAIQDEHGRPLAAVYVPDNLLLF